MIAGVRLDIGPVGNVERLVHCKPPLLGVLANTAIVSLCLEILSIKCMALWVVNHILESPNLIGICLSANYTAAEPLIYSGRVGHWTLAWSFYVASFAFLAIFSHWCWVKIELAWDAWVCWIAPVWSLEFLFFLHDLSYVNASCFVYLRVKSKASLAVLAVECKVNHVRF